jgi:hypothetical protein
VQRPIYFISEVLTESKVRYPAVQKLLYAILITSRKLRHYFDEYKITVITDFPLVDILHNQDAPGHISKWAVELGALSIDFKPGTTIKSQALVNFMAEWRENQVPTPVDNQSTGPCILMGPSSSTAAAPVFCLFLHEVNN